MYLYIKALHIIFIVTWFAGLFYVVRLFIYNTEAQERDTTAREILHQQFSLMIRRLWLGITWPSAILTLILGLWNWYLIGYTPGWLILKLGFVMGLFVYHISLHILYRQQLRKEFRYTSLQLRIWNEVATLFLVTLVMLAVVKQELNLLGGLAMLAGLIILLFLSIRIYKHLRKK